MMMMSLDHADDGKEVQQQAGTHCVDACMPSTKSFNRVIVATHISMPCMCYVNDP
jgi:hypothetical protein